MAQKLVIAQLVLLGLLVVNQSYAQDKSTTVKSTEPKAQHLSCGYRNEDGIGFTIGGDETGDANFGEFPWMASLLREATIGDSLVKLYQCGGSLIAPNVVLTSAYCVLNNTANNLIIRAGEWDSQSTQEILPHEDRRVKEIIKHKDYNEATQSNDMALLILESPLELLEHISPICLPSADAKFDTSNCFTTGWGKDTSGKYQIILRKYPVTVQAADVSQEKLRHTDLGKDFKLQDSSICAIVKDNQDICNGNEGSPLVCAIPDAKQRYYQVGIVSKTIGCGEKDVPNIYAKVPYLRQWLDEKLKLKGIDAAFYTAE